MVGAVGLYLAINSGRSSAHGWGVAMSTDTAFALGLLALLGRHAPERLRGFILTLTVVDDIERWMAQLSEEDAQLRRPL